MCLLSHISPLERLFVLKTLSRTQRATKVKKFVGFSLKPLRCRDPELPPLCGRAYSRPFFLLKARMRILAPPSVFPASAYNYISAATCLINPRRACAARVTVIVLSVCLSVCLSVRLSVCPSVTAFSATTRNKQVK